MIEWFETTFGLASSTLFKLLVFVTMCGVLLILRRLVLNITWQRFDDTRVRYTWRKNISYVTALLCLLTAAITWLNIGRSLATYLGLLSAGWAVALNEPLKNLVGWAFIIWRKPFEFGDRIQIGEHAGDVVDIRLFEFTILEIANWVAADLALSMPTAPASRHFP
ncbi:MAG: mechanosensitive ion channel [Anaerolineae bacterium]|nr:mechanosensitive ion channel [Anaerolineae bacterium]